MVTVLIFTIIGLFIGMALVIQSGIKLTDKCDYSWAFPLVLSAILIITTFTNLVIVGDETSSPHVEDVIKGNAVYQENYHIINNDTIKTYTIVWNKK